MSDNDDRMRRLRDDYYAAHPDQAAEHAARRFELQAIPLPDALARGQYATRRDQQTYVDACRIYRELVVAGDDGLAMREVYAVTYLGQPRLELAVQLLQELDAVTVSREERPVPDGPDPLQTVLRAVR